MVHPVPSNTLRIGSDNGPKSIALHVPHAPLPPTLSINITYHTTYVILTSRIRSFIVFILLALKYSAFQSNDVKDGLISAVSSGAPSANIDSAHLLHER